jgi:hypothetical protein
MSDNPELAGAADRAYQRWIYRKGDCKHSEVLTFRNNTSRSTSLYQLYFDLS